MKLSRSARARLHTMMDDAQAIKDELYYCPSADQPLDYDQDRLRCSLEGLLTFGERVLGEEINGPENIRKTD